MTNLIIRLLPKQVIAEIIIKFLCSETYRNNGEVLTINSVAEYLQMSSRQTAVLLKEYPFRAINSATGEGE